MNNDIDLNEPFINRRIAREYFPIVYRQKPTYINNGGVVKEFKPSFLKKLPEEDGLIWYRLKDFPIDSLSEEKRERVLDATLTLSELRTIGMNASIKGRDTKIFFPQNTLILPVVQENPEDYILPSDEIRPYRAIFKNGKMTLEEIVVCFGCHWSELSTGLTKYGKNVFCIASELPTDIQEKYAHLMIQLKDIPKYINSDEINKKI